MKQNENKTNFSVPFEMIKASEIEPKEVALYLIVFLLSAFDRIVLNVPLLCGFFFLPPLFYFPLSFHTYN